MKDANICREIVNDMKRNIGRAQQRRDSKGRGRITDNKSTALQAIVRAAVRSPQRSKAAGSISQRKTIQALGISSFGSGQRLTSRALEEREKIAAGDDTGWEIFEHEDRSKYSDSFMNKLEHWVETNRHVIDSPFKDDLLLKRDRKGESMICLATKLLACIIAHNFVRQAR